MRNLCLLFVSVIVFGTVSAHSDSNPYNTNHSFVFNEQGIEFAIFKDGQFDFNVLRYRQASAQFTNTNGLKISFNTGYDYAAYIQYDSYGAVIQIENTPIYYDYYGRIRQAGNVHVYYDYSGRVSRIGGLYIHYDAYNYVRTNGYVNRYNRYYRPSVWHSYYRVPSRRFCVLLSTPYRRHYTPIRYRYVNPYRNNRRPIVYRNQSNHNRIVNRRSNLRARYAVNKGKRKAVTTTRRSTNRQTPNATPKRSNRRVTNSTATRRVNTSTQVKRSKPNLKNSRVVAQRTPRTRSIHRKTRQRK